MLGTGLAALHGADPYLRTISLCCCRVTVWTLGVLCSLQSAVCSVQRVASVGCAGPGGLRVTGLVSVRPRLQWSLGPPLLLRPGRASHHTWGGHGAARRPGPATRRQLHGSRLWLDSTARARMVRTSEPLPVSHQARHLALLLADILGPCPRQDGARPQLHIYADSPGRRVWRAARRSGETASETEKKNNFSFFIDRATFHASCPDSHCGVETRHRAAARVCQTLNLCRRDTGTGTGTHLCHCLSCGAWRVVLEKFHPKVCNHGEGPY